MPKPPKKHAKVWVYRPPKPPKPPVPDAIKAEVTAKANELVAIVLKPRYVKPPPENPQFNYIVDLTTKWYRGYFHFSATYRSPGPDALSPSFEAKFARLEYAGSGRFRLAFMRHTGEWIELYTDLALDECLAAIRDDPFFALG